MIAAALQLEVDKHIERLSDAQGRALAVRNGRARDRKVTVGASTIAIRALRVHDRQPGQRFTSIALFPKSIRTSVGVSKRAAGNRKPLV